MAAPAEACVCVVCICVLCVILYVCVARPAACFIPERRLVEAYTRGDIPFFVNATAGTTVTGAFDPFDRIASVIDKVSRSHNFGRTPGDDSSPPVVPWLHIDGSMGGSVVFSGTHSGLLHGAARADSVTVNPHKMLSVPLQTSMLLTARRGDLHVR